MSNVQELLSKINDLSDDALSTQKHQNELIQQFLTKHKGMRETIENKLGQGYLDQPREFHKDWNLLHLLIKCLQRGFEKKEGDQELYRSFLFCYGPKLDGQDIVEVNRCEVYFIDSPYRANVEGLLCKKDVHHSLERNIFEAAIEVIQYINSKNLI